MTEHNKFKLNKNKNLKLLRDDDAILLEIKLLYYFTS